MSAEVKLDAHAQQAFYWPSYLPSWVYTHVLINALNSKVEQQI